MSNRVLIRHFIIQLAAFIIPLAIAYRCWIKFTAHEQYYDNDKALDTLIAAIVWALSYTIYVLIKMIIYLVNKSLLWRSSLLFLVLIALFVFTCLQNKALIETFLKKSGAF